MTQPTSIATARLVLRAAAPGDAAAIRALAGARAQADRTLDPHGERTADAWVDASVSAGDAPTFAIVRAQDGALVGAIGLALEAGRKRARMHVWLGAAYRGRGYATEAAVAVVAYGFETLGLERIWAPRYRGNGASGRVLDKVGFAHEGSRRRFVAERGCNEVVEQHGMLRWEYFARTAPCGVDAGTEREAQ